MMVVKFGAPGLSSRFGMAISRTKVLELFVIESGTASLLGRRWLAELITEDILIIVQILIL